MTTPAPQMEVPAPAALHDVLDSLAEKGQLRWLAPTFARFLATLTEPAALPGPAGEQGDNGPAGGGGHDTAGSSLHGAGIAAPVLLAAALLTEFEGQGHS